MSIFGPAWFTRKGDGIGNLPVCDVTWSTKTTNWNHHQAGVTWIDNPSYEPFNMKDDDPSSANNLVRTRSDPYSFARLPSFATFKRAKLRLSSNSMVEGFKIYLARDGPEENDLSKVPVKVKLLFNVPEKTDPEYPTSGNFSFPLNDDTSIPMFSGHSYAYLWETLDTSTIPTGSLTYSLVSKLHFGGAGT